MVPNYIMIGGFLGAGKSTSVLRLAEYLSAHGRRAGLITNDQGVGLVDTEVVRWSGFAVERRRSKAQGFAPIDHLMLPGVC